MKILKYEVKPETLRLNYIDLYLKSTPTENPDFWIVTTEISDAQVYNNKRARQLRVRYNKLTGSKTYLREIDVKYDDNKRIVYGGR